MTSFVLFPTAHVEMIHKIPAEMFYSNVRSGTHSGDSSNSWNNDINHQVSSVLRNVLANTPTLSAGT